jgi:outer membrane protein
MLDLNLPNMKKLLLASVTALFVVSLNAQTQQGKFLFSGSSTINASFMTTKASYDGQNAPDDTKETTLKIQPTIGYFVINNLAIELSTALEYSKTKAGSNESSSTSLIIGPLVRYYVGQSKVKPYMEGGLGLSTHQSKAEDGSEMKFSGMAYQIGLGVGYFVNEHVSIDGIVNYMGTNLKYSEDSKLKISLGGINIGLGFTVCF